MKGIITEEDWDQWKNDLTVDYIRDNHFTELKEGEVLRERLQTMDQVSQYVGEYFSKEWVMKNVLHLGDDDIKELKKQIEDEQNSGEIDNPDEEEQQQEVPQQEPQGQKHSIDINVNNGDK